MMTEQETEQGRTRGVLANTGFNILGTFASFPIGIVTSILVARTLGAEAWGLYSLVLWFRLTLALTVDIGLTRAVTKFVAQYIAGGERATANRLTLGILGTQGLLVFPLALAISLGAPFVAGLLGQPRLVPYIPLVAALFTLSMLNDIIVARLIGMQRFGVTNMLAVSSGAVTLLGTWFVLARSLGIGGLLWLEIGLVGVQLLVVGTVFIRSGTFLPWHGGERIQLRPLARYCLGVFIITTCDAVVWQRSETFFLSRYGSLQDVAFYGIAYNIAHTIMLTLPYALGSALFPAFADRFGANDHPVLRTMDTRATRAVALLAFPMCAGGAALAAPAINWLYGAAFAPAALLLGLLLVGATAGALGAPQSVLLLAIGRPDAAAFWVVPLAAVNLVLGYLLISRFGALGAAVANSACQVAGVVAVRAYLRRAHGFALPIGPFARIALAAIIAGVVARAASSFGGDVLAVALGTLGGGAAYVVALLGVGALSTADFALLDELIGRSPYGAGRLRRLLAGSQRFAALTWKMRGTLRVLALGSRPTGRNG